MCRIYVRAADIRPLRTGCLQRLGAVNAAGSTCGDAACVYRIKWNMAFDCVTASAMQDFTRSGAQVRYANAPHTGALKRALTLQTKRNIGCAPPALWPKRSLRGRG